MGGAGNFGVVPVATPRCNIWLCIIPLLLLLVPLLYLLSQLSSVTPPPPVPLGPPGTCTIYGDPHIMTFDNKHVDFYSQGEYWIVKSDAVKIQGRYMPTPITHGLSVTKEIAVSGSFINGHKLRISAQTASWDGRPILAGFPSTFNNADPLVDLRYDGQGMLLQSGREGKALHVVHATLPGGVSLQVNRWNEAGEGDYINVKITMPRQPNQDGHCGNFNGNAADDDRLQIRARVGTTGVDPSELLFNRKTPVVVANRPDINNCPEERSHQAKDLCKQKEHTFMPSMQCMIDVCFGGPQFATQDA